MRIWLLAENWPPRRGGIANYLSHISEEMAEMGHAVTVITPQIGKVESRITDHGSRITVLRRRFFVPFMWPSWLPLFILLWQRAKRERPDFLICGKGLFEGLVGYYLKRHVGIPYAVCTYGMEIAAWSGKPGTTRKLRRALGMADTVTYINDVTKQRLLALGVLESRLLKLLPGVDARFLQTIVEPLAASTAQHFGVSGPYVLSVGRLVARKGFDTLIDAFAMLDQTKHAQQKLVIVGDGPDRERLKRLVANQYLQTSVVWLPDVDDKHLPALYAGAEIFALLPRDIAGDIEGFGIVFLEAAAMGVPTLGTTSGGVPSAVTDGETGLLVEPDNVAAAAAALTRLLDDAALRKQLGKRGQNRVRESFQWANQRPLLNRLIKPVT